MVNENSNIEVGNDTLIEIKNTNDSEIPFIKILSNNKFWCTACSKIGILSIECKKKLSNVKSHCNSQKHKKQVKIYDLIHNVLRIQTAHEFHRSITEVLAIDNIPFDKLMKGTAFNKWIEINTGYTLFTPAHYRSNILPSIAEIHRENAYKQLVNKHFWLAIDGGQDKVGRAIYNVIGGVLDANNSVVNIIRVL